MSKGSCESPDFLAINSPVDLGGSDATSNHEPDNTGASRVPPLGLALLLTYLSNQGNTVEMLDVENGKLDTATVVEAVRRKNPRVVGINVFTPTLENGQAIARELPDDTVLVIGGPHVTALPEETLAYFGKVHPNSFAIPGFVGQTEQALAQLVDDPKRKVIPSVWKYEHGQVVRPQTVQNDVMFDQLPVPDPRFAPDYIDRQGRRVASLVTSVRCIYSCTFCSDASDGRTVSVPAQHRSESNVVGEISNRLNLGAEYIRFMDDLFIINPQSVLHLLEKINANENRTFPWTANTRANIVAKWTDNTVLALQENGLEVAEMGVESRSDRVRKIIRKQITWDEVLTAISKLTGQKVKTKIYMMLGIPGETKEESIASIEGSKELVRWGKGMCKVSMFAFRPYAGTEEANKLFTKGWTREQLWQIQMVGNKTRSNMGIVPKHQYAGLEPRKYAAMIDSFDEWQRREIGSW